MVKETFLVVNDSYLDMSSEIIKCDSLIEANLQLATLSFGNLDDEIKIFHGVLTSATFIPEDFKGCTPYIYIRNPASDVYKAVENEAYFERSKCDPDIVALTIQELLSEKTYKFNNMHYDVNIDDVQLFFGHELEKVLNVPEDHLDEELIDRVSKLADFIIEQDVKFKKGECNA